MKKPISVKDGKKENIRRHHNYFPFIFSMLKVLSENNILDDLTKRAEEKKKIKLQKAKERKEKEKEKEKEKTTDKNDTTNTTTTVTTSSTASSNDKTNKTQ